MMSYNSVPVNTGSEPVNVRPAEGGRLVEDDTLGTIGKINARTSDALLVIREKAKTIYAFLEMSDMAADGPPPQCCLHDTVRINLMLAHEIEEMLDAIATSLGVGS